ncbi:putative daf-9 isoform A [Stipitochalara longipes BDJ]|nr:putative daf-9 isoform A [Stipitochalara longipes BDJ]
MALLNLLTLYSTVTALITSLLLTIIGYFLFNEWTRYHSRVKGLSGPTGLPVIGNLHQISGKPASEQYRSEINSRPVLAFFHQKASSAALSIGMSPWDESCKKKTKIAATSLNRSRTVGYHPLLKHESSELMAALLEVGHAGKIAFIPEPVVHRFALNLSLTLNYGTRAGSTKTFQTSPTFQEAIAVEEEIGKLRSVGLNYANYIPSLRFLQSISKSFGTSPTQNATNVGTRRADYNRVFLDELKKRVFENTDSPCIQGGVLRDPESSNLTETELLGISFSIMAGSETNTPTIGFAMLLLSQRPDLQKQAFDAITESGAFGEDALALDGEVPYIMAFTKEVLRYYTPLRLAMPKATTDVVEWQGTKIPKGTMVFLNAWSCNREEGTFEDPFTFEPRRWLSADPHQHYSFGYGGRMCVASHFANKALYTVFLHLISNFEIFPGNEDEGSIEIDPLTGIDNVNHQRAALRWRKLWFVPRDLNRLRSALSA